MAAKKRKRRSWESKELSDIDRYWKRRPTETEGKRQASIHRTAQRSSGR
jgi:hypothetical protein